MRVTMKGTHGPGAPGEGRRGGLSPRIRSQGMLPVPAGGLGPLAGGRRGRPRTEVRELLPTEQWRSFRARTAVCNTQAPAADPQVRGALGPAPRGGSVTVYVRIGVWVLSHEMFIRPTLAPLRRGYL